MEGIFSTLVNSVFIVLGICLMAGICFRVYKDVFSREMSAKAKVIDKNEFEKRVVSKAQAPYTQKKYVVIFDADGRRKSFYVSEASYKSCKVGEKGVLKYKGSKFHDFS